MCVYKDNSDCHVEGRWEGTVARDPIRLKRYISWWHIISQIVYLFIVPHPGFGRPRKHLLVGIVTDVSWARVMFPGETSLGDPKEVR